MTTRAARPDVQAFIRANLPVSAVPSIPEVRLHLAGPRSGLRRLAERDDDFNGRSRRSHAWANWACWFGASAVLLIAIGVTAGAHPDPTKLNPLVVVLSLAVVAVALLSFVDNLAMMFRRAHDTNKSGWIWLLLMIPLVNLLALYWLLIQDSDHGANRYGPPTKTFYQAGPGQDAGPVS